MRNAPGVAGLLALAACYAPAPGTGAPCASDDACPGAQRCVANVCEPPGVLGDAVTVDAGPIIDAPGPIGAWQPPEVVLPCEGCDDPTLTDDELELYTNQGDARIYASVRTSPDEAWPTPTLVDVLAATGSTEHTPNLVGNGLALYFARRVGSGSFDLYVTRRASRSAAWSIPVRIEELSGDATDETDPWVTPDEHFMFFERRSGGDYDLWYAVRSSTSEPWGPPQSASLWNSDGDDSGAVATRDGREAFFASNRNGHGQLFTATSPAGETNFGAGTVIEELDLAMHQADPWISADARRLYFTREDASGRALVRSQR